MAIATTAMTVRFAHPRDSGLKFTADVSPACTGQQAISGLIAGDETGPFLDAPAQGRPYELVLARTGTAITPNMTLAEAGVLDGDEIQVMQRGMGAGRPSLAR
jgi:hypothetical protein